MMEVMLDVEAVNMAAQRVFLGQRNVKHTKRIINLNRKDDTVPYLPSTWWKHIGETHWLDTKEVHDGFDHKIKHYVTAMNMQHVQDAVPVRFA